MAARLHNLLFRGRRSPTFAALPVIVALSGLLVLIAPLRDAEQPLLRVGVLLVVGGMLENLHSVRRASSADVRRGLVSGALTLVMAFFVINAPFLAGAAVVFFLAGSFALDAIGYGAVVLEIPRSVPDGFRELAERDL